MKKTYIYWSLFALTFFLSCEKEEDKAVLNENASAPSFTNPSDGYSKVISPADTTESLIFRWNCADYGIETPVTYTLYLDSADNQFSEAIVLGTTTQDSLSLTFGSINRKLLNNMGLPKNVESVLELKILASVNDLFPVYSGSIYLRITPWVKKDSVIVIEEPESMHVLGDFENWTASDAPSIRAIDNSAYEGYVYMNIAGKIKFSIGDENPVVYGYGGSSGILSTDKSDSISIDSSGYYKINVNTSTLTYVLYPVESWGIIGTATEGIWDNSTPMTYDVVNDVWKVTADLLAGALKFRADNAWGLNYGPEDPTRLKGKLISTDASISISEVGNYTITIDFSRSAEPYEYMYSIVKN